MSAVVAGNIAKDAEILLESTPLSSSPRTSPPEAKPDSKGNTGVPCALAYLNGSSASSPATKKLLPAIRSRNNGQESHSDDLIKGAFNKNFIPVDILNSLTQIPSPPSREQLGPPTKFKKNPIVEVSLCNSLGPIAETQFSYCLS